MIVINGDVMEDNSRLIENLLERAAAYGKTSLELAKLKAADKTSDVGSTILSHSIVMAIAALFILFLNTGLALWLGGILGPVWAGFLVVAAFYGIAGFCVHLFLRKWLKDSFRNYIVKQLLK